jgi:GTP-binding protein YchF
MKIALIGLPQAGKRTLFTLLTRRQVPDGRKPGESIEGISAIRDPRVNVLAEMFKPEKTTYAENNFVLCPDADTGGSHEWLDAARRCHLVCLVVRAFDDESVYHPAGTVDANRDAENLEAELLLADMALVETRLERLARESKSGLKPEQEREKSVLDRAMARLEEGERLEGLELDDSDRAAVRSLDLVTFLPVLRVYNVSEANLGDEFGAASVGVSCQIEAEVAEMEDADERREYLEALGLTAPGVDRVSAAAYDALGLMSYYTVGEDECRAWTIRQGALAPEAGGSIHSDIERGFIRAEVMAYENFVSAGSEVEAKNQGLMQTRGRDYVVEDGDIMHFLFNV